MRALIGIIAATSLLVGCGKSLDPEVKGHAGFARSAAGDLQIWVNPCGLEINNVHVAGPIEKINGSQMANKFYADFESGTRHPESFELSYADTNEGWESSVRELPTTPDSKVFLDATALKKNGATFPTDTTGRDLAELQPGVVIVGKNERWTPEEFASCESRFRYLVSTYPSAG